MNTLVTPMVGMPGGWELVLIVLVLIMLFGAKKLPELARGSGRALRIFKAETKGLLDDDEDGDGRTAAERDALEARSSTPEARPVDQPVEQTRPDTDR